jgi:heterodisulfide reductase subunit A
MVDAGRHPNITLLSYSEVEQVSGFVGQFDVRIRKRARSVIEDLCTSCGICQEKCPTKVLDTAYEAGMGRRKSIYRPFAGSIPSYPVLDREHCLFFTKGRCKLCERFCPTGAIDYDQEDEIIDVEVGAIILATGYQMWDPSQLDDYSYGKSPNVITGLQFERLSTATGPTGGEIVTAEGKVPEKVAFIHCVGSRDERAHAYCSRFCCMYALKQAHQVHDKTGAEVYDFYMDMRTFGKAYEEFYGRVRSEGIRFIQGRPSQIIEDPATKKLYVLAEDILLGQVIEIEVDLVILANAAEPQHDAPQIGAMFGVSRTPDGFFAEAHPKLQPVETSTAGVFLAGSCQSPRDVPDTVAHAGAAAMEAVRLFNQGQVTISPTVAQVDEPLCVGCGECLTSCPYSAIERNIRGKAEINPALCHGCGTCAATCPSGAITALHFTDEEIVAQIDGLLRVMA